MKLDMTMPDVEISGQIDEKLFSIGDPRIIYDILRSKMYSNPILAICREYISNGQDAHREVGDFKTPITVHLPNNIEPYFKVKDVGPGISPDRIENVFIKYGCSTKREDNIQRGSFGLGSKCFASYTDSFTVITTVDGTQYNYNIFIDETKAGKLMLASTCETSAPNGTEIIIPVQSKDFNAFNIHTEIVCRHWAVKPIIKGGTINWQIPNKILEGSNWALTAKANNYDYHYTTKIINDGIEYPLDTSALRNYADADILDAAKGNFLLYFNTGDLSLSSNREQIYLDDKSKKAISDRIKLVNSEIKNVIQDKINISNNLWEAYKCYHLEINKLFSSTNFMGKITWHGTEMSADYINTICNVFYFSKEYNHYSRNKKSNNKINRSRRNHLVPSDLCLLYLNDTSLEEPTYRHVKTAFDNNPSIKSVIVVCPNKTITEDVLNDKHNLNLMEPKLLSSITTVSTRTSTSGIIRTMIFKYGDDKFGRSSISAFEQDTKPKVIVNTNKSGNGRELRHDKLNFYTLKSLLNYAKDVSFYGVDSKVDVDKILKKYPTTKSFEAFLNDRIINSNREDYVKMLAMNASSSSSSDIRYLYPVCKFISDKSSLFVKTLEANNLVSYDRVAADKASIYQQLTSPITEKEIADYLANHPEIDVDNMKEAFKNKYPMLMIIRSYYIEDCAKGIADYINLIDKN